MPAKPKPGRRTKVQMDEFYRQLIKFADPSEPQSVRHVFYRMTDPRLSSAVEKSDKGYRRVQDRLATLRRRGDIPYNAIVDASRRVYRNDGYAGLDEFADEAADLYRRDVWRETTHRVEVWVESRSLAGTLVGLCRTLGVSLYPCGGFSSLTFVRDAAEEMMASRDVNGAPQHALIFYAGDRDAAGLHIMESLETELRLQLRELAWDRDLDFIPLAVTERQVNELDLPRKPRDWDSKDRRKPELDYAVEAESIPATVMRGIFRDAIEGVAPDGLLDAVRVAEQSERQTIRHLLSQYSSVG